MTGILNCFERNRNSNNRCRELAQKIIYGDADNEKRFPNRIAEEDVEYLPLPQYITKDAKKWFGLIGKPCLEAFNTVGGLFYFINTIAEGYPSVYAKVMEDFLAYGSIPVGILSATATTLSQSTYAFAGLPVAFVKAVNKTIVVAASNCQMTFEAITLIYRHKHQLPPTAEVDIGTVTAWATIILNFAAALIRGVQAYHLENFNGPPVVIPPQPLFGHYDIPNARIEKSCSQKTLELFNKIACSQLFTRTFTLLDVAGATNLFIGELAKIFFPHASTLEPLIRYGAAFFVGSLATALAGGPVRTKRNAVEKTVDMGTNLIRFAGVGLMIGSRIAGIAGFAVICEQLIFWCAGILIYNFLSQLAVHYAFNKLSEKACQLAHLDDSDSELEGHPGACGCCACLPFFQTHSQPKENTSLLAQSAVPAVPTGEDQDLLARNEQRDRKRRCCL